MIGFFAFEATVLFKTKVGAQLSTIFIESSNPKGLSSYLGG